MFAKGWRKFGKGFFILHLENLYFSYYKHLLSASSVYRVSPWKTKSAWTNSTNFIPPLKSGGVFLAMFLIYFRWVYFLFIRNWKSTKAISFLFGVSSFQRSVSRRYCKVPRVTPKGFSRTTHGPRHGLLMMMAHYRENTAKSAQRKCT